METTKISINWMELAMIEHNAKEIELYWELELDECEKFTKEHKISCWELEDGYYQYKKNEYIKQKAERNKEQFQKLRIVMTQKSKKTMMQDIIL
jgi:hypothetical protein